MSTGNTLRRLARILFRLGLLAGLLLLLVLVSLTLRPLREAALRRIISSLSSSFPGQLEVDRLHWTHLSELEAEGLRWTDRGDTLAASARLHLQLDLPALLHRDLHLFDLQMDEVRADLPSLRSTLSSHRSSPATSDGLSAKKPGNAELFFPRSGSLPPLPSMAISHLKIDLRSVLLAPTDTLRAGLELGAELRRAHQPHLQGTIFLAEAEGSSLQLVLDTPSDGLFRLARMDTAGGRWLLLTLQREEASDTLRSSLQTELELSLPAQAERNRIPYLRRYLPEDRLPADLAFSLHAAATLKSDSISVDAHFEGSAPSLSLDSFEGELSASRMDDDLSALLRLRTQVHGLILSTSAALNHSQPLQILMSPVRVDLAASEEKSFPPIEGAQGPALLSNGPAGWKIGGLKVVGALGEGVIDAEIPSSAPATAHLRWSWPEVPAILSRALETTAFEDSLRGALWKEASYHLDAYLLHDATVDSTRLSAVALLPAPWRFSSRIPASLTTSVAPLRLELSSVRHRERGTVLVHADSNAWLRRLQARGGWSPSHLELDSLSILLPGANLSAALVLDHERLRGKGQLELDDTCILSSLLSLPDSLRAHLGMDWTLGGTLHSLDAQAEAVARIHAPGLDLPRLDATLEIAGGHPRSLVLDAPTPLRWKSMQLENATVQWRPERELLLPSWVALQGRGKEFGFTQVARIDSSAGSWTAEVDTLGLSWQDRVMRSSAPFLLRFDPRLRQATIERIDLRGSLGHLKGDLLLLPGQSRGDLSLELLPPPRIAGEEPWPLPWPTHLQSQLHLCPDSLGLDLEASGLEMAGKHSISMRVVLRSTGESTSGRLSLSDSLSSLLDTDFSLPFTLDDSTFTFVRHGDAHRVQLEMRDLPFIPLRDLRRRGAVALLDADPADALHLHAWARLEGKDGHSRVFATAMIDGATNSVLTKGRLRLAGIWGEYLKPPNGLPAWAKEDSLFRQLWRERNDDNLHLALSLRDSLTSVLTGKATLPLTIGNGRLHRREGDMHLELMSSELDLAHFQGLVPAEGFLRGILSLHLLADGSMENPSVEGELIAREIESGIAGRARAQGNLRFTLEGTKESPRVRGEVEITESQIRIPNRSSSLHPVEGSSLFWELTRADSLARSPGTVTPDSAAVALKQKEDEEKIPLPSKLDMAVKVEVPRNLWIRGRGLDVRLAGTLDLHQSDGRLAVDGELETTEGTFSFMNKTFRLRRGNVIFFGNPVDPQLDITMGITVSNADITIDIKGSIQDPKLDFHSSPSMDEADIFSYLLFGGPATNLDEAGSDLVQQQAVNAVEAFAIPQLESGLGEELGISMIQLKQSEDQDQSLSLVVGKYITPQILLKYEQSLSDNQVYSLNLEYWINRHLRLQSFYSEQRHSGVEAIWRKDY